MRLYRIAGCVLCAVLTLAGCEPSAPEKTETEAPRTVRVETVSREDLPVLVEVVGRLIPNREVIVSAQVGGILKTVHAVIGARVTAGDPLATIDPTDYQLALNEVRANLLSAKARLAAAANAYARARNLLPDKAITPQLYDQSEAEYKSAKAQVAQMEAAVDIAERRLEKTSIKAPFDGFITHRMVELGQNVAIGDPVMGIADLATMRVKIHVNERDYLHLDKTDTVHVTIDAVSPRPFKGRIEKIGIQADVQTNTFEIEILLDNPQVRLKAGLTARVAIEARIIRDAIMIPQSCVLFRQDGDEVFVIDADGLAQPRKVKLGQLSDARVQVVSGLSSGDTLVVTGAQYLKPRDKVTIVP